MALAYQDNSLHLDGQSLSTLADKFGTPLYVYSQAVMNDLIRPMLYDAYHPMWPVTRRPGAAAQPVDIVGPVCETTDTFARLGQLQRASRATCWPSSR